MLSWNCASCGSMCWKSHLVCWECGSQRTQSPMRARTLGAAAEKANGSMLRGNSDTTTPTACIMTPTDHDTPMKPRTRLGSRERTSAHVVNGKTTQELRDELNKLRHARRSTQSQNTIKKKEVVTRKTHSSKLVARSSSGERQNRVSGDGRQVSCSGKPCVDSCPKLR